MPNPDTHGSRLIKVIVAHGPLIGAELAEKAGLPAKNIDPYLASAIKNGTIHTRMGFVAELGKERKHYMTATQAEAWDSNRGHAMSHPCAIMEHPAPMQEDLRALAAERDGLLGLLGVLAERLQVREHHEIPAALDELLHALSTRAAIHQASAGRLALLLIDSGDLTEVEELPTTDPDDAHQRAMAAVEQGHAARAVVVRIQGEARRHVEWKEAA